MFYNDKQSEKENFFFCIEILHFNNCDCSYDAFMSTSVSYLTLERKTFFFLVQQEAFRYIFDHRFDFEIKKTCPVLSLFQESLMIFFFFASFRFHRTLKKPCFCSE